MTNIERKPEHKPKPCHVMVALDGEPKNIVPADAIVPMIYEVMEYVPASQLAGAVDRIAELGAENARQAEALKAAREALETASAEMYESLRRQGGQ
jgi:uncharacterized membrane protein